MHCIIWCRIKSLLADSSGYHPGNLQKESLLRKHHCQLMPHCMRTLSTQDSHRKNRRCLLQHNGRLSPRPAAKQTHLGVSPRFLSRSRKTHLRQVSKHSSYPTELTKSCPPYSRYQPRNAQPAKWYGRNSCMHSTSSTLTLGVSMVLRGTSNLRGKGIHQSRSMSLIPRGRSRLQIWDDMLVGWRGSMSGEARHSYLRSSLAILLMPAQIPGGRYLEARLPCASWKVS